MGCRECGMSHRNSIHHNMSQNGYHMFIEIEEKEDKGHLFDRIDDIERRLDRLESEKFQGEL